MSLSSLPNEIFPIIADFCSVADQTLLNFSLITRHCYQAIYMKHPNLYSTRINRITRLILYELQQLKLSTPSKYKRVRSEDDKSNKEETKLTQEEERTQSQFNNIFHFVKEKKEFMEAQNTVKSKLFEKWDNFLDKYDAKTKQAVHDEIFSNFILLSAEEVVVGDFRRNYHLVGKIGNEDFHFKAYDEQNPETTQWSMGFAGTSFLACYDSDECYLYESVATKFLKKHNLKITPLNLIEILLALQPWFFDNTFARFKNEAKNGDVLFSYD